METIVEQNRVVLVEHLILLEELIKLAERARDKVKAALIW